MNHEVLKGGKCNAKCIYFPDFSSINIEYNIDKNGVKHCKNSKPYFCGRKCRNIVFDKPCEERREVVIICRAEDVEDVVQMS